ncbi:hypothetical protein PspLS_03247, partial [Pyricularia sp. CBS 133598]
MRLNIILTMLVSVASCSSDPSEHRHQFRHPHAAPAAHPAKRRAAESSSGARSTAPPQSIIASPTSSSPVTRPANEKPRVTSSVGILITELEGGVAQIITARPGPPPDTKGTVITKLNTTGHATIAPLLTRPIPPVKERFEVDLQARSAAAVATRTPEYRPAVARMAAPNIFAEPISTNPPHAKFQRRDDHPVGRSSITSLAPYPTNKFFSNMYLGGMRSPAFLHPYSIQWAKGEGVTGSWGFAISHTEPNQRVFGPPDPMTKASKYFINPIGIHSIVLSAQELGPQTQLAMTELCAFSAMAELRASPGSQPVLRMPFVQGSGFITGIYNGARPIISSGVYFRQVLRANQNPQPGVVKYKMFLEDGKSWLLYARHTSGNPLILDVVDSKNFKAREPFSGTIQIAKEPGDAEAIYDQACGAYATSMELSGTASGSSGSYTFTFKRAGLASSKLLMFALPHHADGFSDASRQAVTGLKLHTTTKGVATGILADSWTIRETLTPGVGFLPWDRRRGEITQLGNSARMAVLRIAQQELAQNMIDQANLDSMYFSGKALAKFASIIIVANDLLKNPEVAHTGLNQLKRAFAIFAENRQKFPLVYDTRWGGIVSSASYVTGQPGIDFGNTYYNDHHFHYGYFVYTAAVIAHIDKAWGNANKEFVNTLVRDFANPSAKDGFFTMYRNFDWYHGHSWAHGLYDTLDGNDQESSSEDAMSAYAVKMWGRAIGDANMEARGELQLAVQARAFKYYYLYTSDNKVQPAEFVGNKVAGILFENKIDHTTFFGANIEFIQGIHMIPLMPFSPLTRSDQFVREEWATYFDNGRINEMQGGWRGILMGNYAQINPAMAYSFFGSSKFDPGFLDGGASRTWYMAYSAASHSGVSRESAVYHEWRLSFSALLLGRPGEAGF